MLALPKQQVASPILRLYRRGKENRAMGITSQSAKNVSTKLSELE
jgi:hypothetical protein